jgi:hypothetical protein
MVAAFQLLAKDPAITVSQNGAAYLHVDARAEHISDVNALLVTNGIKVYELTPTQESLEEAFLRLTGDVNR